MSQPISMCLISKAARGDEESLNFLIEAMKENKRFGSYTQFPCLCDPPCEAPTKVQIDELNKKVAEATKDIKYEPPFCGTAGEPGRSN